MRTLIVSDLHLGRTGASDLLRRADLREPLLEAIAGVDRFVILGDGLELREAPHRDAMDVAAPFFEAVGAALGAGKELILLAGNHDHGIAAGYIDARLQSEPTGFLGLEQRFAPEASGTSTGSMPTAESCATTRSTSARLLSRLVVSMLVRRAIWAMVASAGVGTVS